MASFCVLTSLNSLISSQSLFYRELGIFDIGHQGIWQWEQFCFFLSNLYAFYFFSWLTRVRLWASFTDTSETKCVNFFPHQQPALMLTGGPTIQFNSDTNNLGLALTKGSFHKTTPPSSPRCWSQFPGCHLYFWQTIYKSSIFLSLIRFDNLLEWLIGLRKILYLLLLIYYKRYNSGQTNRRDAGGQVLGAGGGAVRSFRAFPRHDTFPAPPCVHQPRSPLNCVV